MKHLLVTFAIMLSISAHAQHDFASCANATSSARLADGLKNTYQGSICFTGSGEISSTVSLTEWPWISITTDEQILVNTPIDFSAINAKLFTSGNVQFTNIAMDGGDTLFVKSGLCKVENISSKNSMPDNWNTIVLEEGAELYWSGMLFVSGGEPATISAGGVKGSKVKIVSAGEYHISLNHRD